MPRAAFPLAIARSLVTADPRANGAHIRDLMQGTGRTGARLVHFPEGALTGYAKANVTSWDTVDWGAVREELEATAALAGKLGLWVVLGGNHPLTPPHRPHNSLYVISDAGRLVGRYDKRLCSHTEVTGWYTPGFEPLVFEAGGFRFGLALCVELNFPELFAEYERLGADAVFVSSYSEDPVFGVLAQAHAATNNLWVSLAVPDQCAPAFPSTLWGPNGHRLAGCEGSGPSLAFGVLDPAAPDLDMALNKARPWRRAARAGGIYEERRVDDERSRERSSF